MTNNKVKTGDQTSAWTFAVLALMAAIVYVSLRKKAKEN
ncbi:MAG: LPXTG cell wall anchor domain-containing protein [Coprobacillus sp.]|nr:LPXTG cell wall anchor domain-containing protein [Coprobacillus sp.]